MQIKHRKTQRTSSKVVSDPLIPVGIEFEAPVRTRSDALECRVTNLEQDGKRYSRLTVARWVLNEAGFKSGKKFVALRGKHPHHRWVRVEEADYGQRLPDKGSLSLSITQIIKRGLTLKNEKIKPLLGQDAVYFELPEEWVNKA